MSDLTEAQANFIDWLGEGDGQCVIDRFARFVSHGEVKGSGYAATVLRLVAAGYIEGAGPLRLKLTNKGASAVKSKGNPTHADQYAEYWGSPSPLHMIHGLREEDI